MGAVTAGGNSHVGNLSNASIGASNGGADRSNPRWIRQASVERLLPERLAAAKKAFTTRRVPFGSPDYDWSRATLLSGLRRPRAGDLVLASVTRLGHHSRIELTNGRRSHLHIGEEIVVAYADRYAPDQFESEIPMDLGPTQLVVSGGVASTVLSRHGSTRRATDILPIGLIFNNESTPLNVSDFALQPAEPDRERPRVTAIVGTSMNSGKTTAVGSLILGLRRGGRKPGGAKVTGTGSGHDYWTMVDAGAHCVADFTDAGFASTYRIPLEIIEAILVRLVDHLTNEGCTDIVIEIADGLYQQETERLLRSPVFRDYVDGVIFTAADAMGAVAGVNRLMELDLPVVGVSGMFTRAELAIREVQANTEVPVWTKDDLSAPLDDSALLSSNAVIDLRRYESSSAYNPSPGSTETAVGVV